jgi:hypothetical protein
VLADKLKDGEFQSHETLLACLKELKQEVSSLSDKELDGYIGEQNPPRLDFFNRAEWELGTVDLNKCNVWPHQPADAGVCLFRLLSET